jgi:hypothetical protein
MKMDGCGQATSERRWTEAIRTTRFSEEPGTAAKRIEIVMKPIDLGPPAYCYVPISATGRPPVSKVR